MAGRGPTPQAQHQRERDTKRRVSDRQVVLVEDGELRGPELGGSWPPAVEAWYDVWRRSAQAAVFTPTDWQRLRMLAPLVARYFEEPTTAAMAELRLNEERLGATVADRLRLRFVIEVGSDEEAPVLKLASSRERLAARLGADE